MKRSTKTKSNKKSAPSEAPRMPTPEHEAAMSALVRDLFFLAGRWENFFRHVHLDSRHRVSGPMPQRTLAVAQVLKAIVAAYAQRDDDGLRALSKGASAYLQETIAKRLASSEQLMLPVPEAAIAGRAASFALHTIVPEKGTLLGRPRTVEILRNTLVWKMNRGAGAEDLAHDFLLSASMPFDLAAILAEHNIVLRHEEAAARSGDLAKQLKKIIDRSRADSDDEKRELAKRLIICGMKFLGMPKSPAEGLFDFERTPEKRAKRA